MPSLPLAGIRVVSVEQFGAAPYATMFLADMGAEVIKVEAPAGDYSRWTGPRTLGELDSSYFQCMNLNKKSVVIDLNDPDDRAFFDELVKTAHAVTNNLRGSLPAKLGLDYRALGKLRPSVVCGHISAYGRANSRADRPGYDFLMQAEAGLMDLTGEPDGPPARMGVSMVDYMTGMMLAFGIVCALRAAAASGEGADVDVSLFDTALHQLAYQGTWCLNGEGVTTRIARSAHPANTPVQLYKTADGWIYVAAMTVKFWSLLTAAVGRPELFDDPRFDTPDSRLANRDELTIVLDAIFGQRATAEWVALLGGTIPVAPVYDLEQALRNPFLAEAGMIDEIDHPNRRGMKVLANPIKLNGKRLPRKRGPKLGEHTVALRAQVGLGPAAWVPRIAPRDPLEI